MVATRRPKPSRRTLREAYAAAVGSPLTVDKDAKIIYGVKVLGVRSRNSHGLREAVNGTEYTRDCMEQAIPLYEGVDVLTDHNTSRGNRSVTEAFGKLRNVRLGADGLRADLHYFDSHPLSPRVIEDVERGMGVYGLSHDAQASRERIDRAGKRLVIEGLATVRSVDLVRNPATNRNLWESGDMPQQKTYRQLLEALVPKWTGRKAQAARSLLEMGEGDMPEMDVPADMPADMPDDPAEAADPHAALTEGVKAAVIACLDDEDMSADEKIKKIKKYVKGHEAMTSEESSSGGGKSGDYSEPDESDETPDTDKTEAVKENAQLKHKLAVRDLFESTDVKPTAALREACEALPIAKARALLEDQRRSAGGVKSRTPAAGSNGRNKPARGSSFVDAITD